MIGMHNMIYMLREKGFVTKEPVSEMESEYNTVIRPTIEEIAGQYTTICEYLNNEYQNKFNKFLNYTQSEDMDEKVTNEYGAEARVAKELYIEFADSHLFKPKKNYRECDYMTDEKRFFLRQNKDVR